MKVKLIKSMLYNVNLSKNKLYINWLVKLFDFIKHLVYQASQKVKFEIKPSYYLLVLKYMLICR